MPVSSHIFPQNCEHLMQDFLKITLVQHDPLWRSVSANLERLSQKIEAVKEQTDLILLPEMFSTGFDMHPEIMAEKMDGSAVHWMQKYAQEKNTAIAGSLIINDKGRYFNRFIFVHPSGNLVHYDKKHLFHFAGEDRVYTPGTNRLLFEYKGWKISPFICYDLRFPVWSRNTENYDVALYVANWPKTRIAAWNVLLKARAIENQSYCVGVNRVGTDGNGHEYNGHSQVIDPLGAVLQRSEIEEVFTVTLDKKNLKHIRQSFPFLKDRDRFNF
jgi:omega-amidase